MAIGENRYNNSTNLESIANAITSMGQSANKKDKPGVLAEKIKAISTDATGVESEMLAGKTFYAGGNKKTGSMSNNGAWTNRMGINGKIAIPAGYHNGSGYVDQVIPTKGSQIYTPSTVNQVINAGQYISGSQTIAGDPNLLAENIKIGQSIFGVEGTFAGLADPNYYMEAGYCNLGMPTKLPDGSDNPYPSWQSNLLRVEGPRTGGFSYYFPVPIDFTYYKNLVAIIEYGGYYVSQMGLVSKDKMDAGSSEFDLYSRYSFNGTSYGSPTKLVLDVSELKGLYYLKFYHWTNYGLSNYSLYFRSIFESMGTGE